MAFLTELESGLKTYGAYFLDSALSIAIVFSLTFTVRLLLPFSGLLIVIVNFASSMSFVFSLHNSPHLAPVSFRVCKNAAVLFPEAAISWSSSASKGTNGFFGVYLALTGSQGILKTVV